VGRAGQAQPDLDQRPAGPVPYGVARARAADVRPAEVRLQAQFVGVLAGQLIHQLRVHDGISFSFVI